MLLVLLLLAMTFVINVSGDDDGLPIILVNRVALEISRENNLNIATYNYLNGDFVDITCMHPDDKIYSYIVTINGIKALHEILEVDQLSSNSRVGIRTTLRNVHNNTTLTCTFSQKGGNTVDVMIKLVLQDTFDDLMDLQINDLPIRSSRDTKYRYYYISKENITLSCETKRDDVMVTENDRRDNLEVNESKKVKRFQWSRFPEEDTTLIYNAYVNKNSKPKRSIEIEFKLLPYWYEASEIPLSLNISADKVLLKVYSINGFQYIVYEYQDNLTITLNCSTTKAIIEKTYVLGLDEKVQGNTTSISTNKHLRADQNNTKLECYVSYMPPNMPIKYIRGIIVHFTKPTEISNTSPGMIIGQADADKGFPYWILLVLGAVVCIAICIYLVWKKKKQRNLSIQRAANSPMVERAEDLYSEPNKPEAFYSVPFKPKPKDIPELNYAVLDLAPSTNVIRNVDNETTLYAEVCHDSARYLR